MSGSLHQFGEYTSVPSAAIEPNESFIGLLSSVEEPIWTEKSDSSEAHPPTNRRRTVITYLRLYGNHARHTLYFFLPSFISAFLVRAKDAPSATKARPTAYLDGLRGVAAWIVFNDHLCHILSKSVQVGFGHGGQNHEFYKLPIIRLVFDGTFSVSLFFVISGYALSVAPVLAMRNAPHDTVIAMRKHASAIFRRPIRLLLPCWAATFLTFTLVRFGVFIFFEARQEQVKTQYDGWGSIEEDWPPQMPSFLNQTHDLILNDIHLLWIFAPWHDHPWITTYDLPLWTIPLELRASLVLYLTHATLFFMHKWTRVTIVSVLVALGVWLEAYDFPLLWAGYVIAELSTLFGEQVAGKRQHFAVSIGATIAAVFGLYVASWPNWGASTTPGYGWMIHLSPWDDEITARWWTGLGATLLVFSLDRLSFPRLLLNCQPIQYLGRISFSLYLMHFWVEQTIGASAFYHGRMLFGGSSTVSAVAGFGIGYGVTLIVAFWVADIFWRAVDIPSVKLARRVEQWLFKQD